MRANKLETVLSRDCLACLAPPDTKCMFFFTYMYFHGPHCINVCIIFQLAILEIINIHCKGVINGYIRTKKLTPTYMYIVHVL